MANKIGVLIQNALQTFTKYNKKIPEFTQLDVHKIKAMTDDVTISDIQEHETSLNKNMADFSRNKRNSLDYLPVYEDDCISVGVFMLREGAKLPIHDHPDMYGIIKVLTGILKVTSYTFVEFDKTVVNNDRVLFYQNPLKVEKHPEVILGIDDESCLLTPTDKNIHEVECIRGPAAFLDILSPPYDAEDAHEPRACHYFEEISSSDDTLRLVQVRRS